MITLRRRLISWLIVAYVKKWGKLIFVFFAVGLFVFFISRFLFEELVSSLRFSNEETIGLVGAYTTEDLPSEILRKVSRGLTSLENDGTVMPDAAVSWKITDNGKTYIFNLSDDIYFSDGKNLTSKDINYNFADVTVERPQDYVIIYRLKDSYSPFLITVSKPIFKKGLIGVSEYRITDLKLNGNFVEQIDLKNKSGDKLIYQFYPTVSALKIAFSLGEVTKIVDLPDIEFKQTTFNDFGNSAVDKKIDYKRLVTLFYNTKDSLVSSKILREALSYTIPDDFDEGERNFGPFTPISFASRNGIEDRNQDLEHAKELLNKAKDDGEVPDKIAVTVKVLPKYKETARKIAEIWKSIGIEASIETADKVPQNFQVFLGEFNLPQDVDQYMLWHSDQKTNITHYTNLRVDKLLEDGRKEIDVEKRKKIYSDFQKFIQSDPPASFIFFPYAFDVTRK